MVSSSVSRAAIAALGMVGVLWVASPVGAQDSKQTPSIRKVTAQPTISLEGKDSFKAYCAVCHGADAKGNGPAAPALKVPPPDLTAITTRHKGEFPTEQIRAVIAGDRQMAAHGSRDMPIWGEVFRSFSGGSEDVQYRLRVTNLLNYLKGIQAK